MTSRADSATIREMRSLLPFLTTLLFASAAGAQPSFMSILPPGQDGFVGSGSAPGPHAGDQRGMYDALTRAVPGLGAADLTAYFKDATIAPPGAP